MVLARPHKKFIIEILNNSFANKLLKKYINTGIVASYVIDPHMFSVPNFDSRLTRDCASCTGDRSYAVYSRSVFSSSLIMLRIKFPVVGYAQVFIK